MTEEAMSEELTREELLWIAKQSTQTIREEISKNGFQSGVIITALMVEHVITAYKNLNKGERIR